MNPKLLALYGLKYNPFSPELPVEALYRTPKTDNFCWRIEHALVREGGFALITGDPGTGKSVILRVLAERLSGIGEMTVGTLTRPGSNQADFYRERQATFSASNSDRITAGAVSSCCVNAGSHAPRRDPAQTRPADRRSAGNVPPSVLNELRLPSSLKFDSKILLVPWFLRATHGSPQNCAATTYCPSVAASAPA